jgi:hypothetical protein
MAGEPKVGEVVDGMEVISVYTAEQAEADAVIMRVGHLDSGDMVYFTASLLAEGYRGDSDKVRELVRRGLEKLEQPNSDDMPHMRLRVVEPDKVWVVQEPGRLTFMKPEDY